VGRRSVLAKLIKSKTLFSDKKACHDRAQLRHANLTIHNKHILSVSSEPSNCLTLCDPQVLPMQTTQDSILMPELPENNDVPTSNVIITGRTNTDQECVFSNYLQSEYLH
jgi:hypothetical protein